MGNLLQQTVQWEGDDQNFKFYELRMMRSMGNENWGVVSWWMPRKNQSVWFWHYIAWDHDICNGNWIIVWAMTSIDPWGASLMGFGSPEVGLSIGAPKNQDKDVRQLSREDLLQALSTQIGILQEKLKEMAF